MLKHVRPMLTRTAVGQVLVLAALFALAGAAMIDATGLVDGLLALPFVGALVCLKLGLFTFWPDIHKKGQGVASSLRGVFVSEDPVKVLQEERELYALNRQGMKPKGLSLWDQNDPRLDVSLFASTVPTFVLSADQRFLDWNPAFDLVFGDLADMRRGAHVSAWFTHLDNFRRVPKRAEKLYGEGILPIADRERVTFLSKRFGRMVFTKIMSPIVDRFSGRIVGWTVVLNINSANKRQEFFERLYGAIAHEGKCIRMAASFDGLFDSYPARQALIRAHLDATAGAHRVLDLGAGTGAMTMALLAGGHKVTAVDGDVHLLRRIKDKYTGYESRVRIVRQDLDDLRIPSMRFDAAIMLESLHRFADPGQALKRVFSGLKVGGTLTLSVRLDGVEPLFESLRRHLEESDRFDNVKHQFGHVLAFEQERAQARCYNFVTREEARALVLEAGFMLEDESSGLQDGHTLLLKARK